MMTLLSESSPSQKVSVAERLSSVPQMPDLVRVRELLPEQ